MGAKRCEFDRLICMSMGIDVFLADQLAGFRLRNGYGTIRICDHWSTGT